jgi:hypothetical protein
MQICQTCKYFKQTTRSCGTLVFGRALKPEEIEEAKKENRIKYYKKKVRLCGCFMPAKTFGIFQTCPIGKWGVHALSEEEMQQILSFVDTLPKFGTYKSETIKELNKWYKLLTGSRKNISTCPTCVRETVRTFRREIKKYKEELLNQDNNADTNAETE